MGAGHRMFVHAGGGLPPSHVAGGCFVDGAEFGESDGERGGLARRCGCAAGRRSAVVGSDLDNGRPCAGHACSGSCCFRQHRAFRRARRSTSFQGAECQHHGSVCLHAFLCFAPHVARGPLVCWRFCNVCTVAFSFEPSRKPSPASTVVFSVCTRGSGCRWDQLCMGSLSPPSPRVPGRCWWNWCFRARRPVGACISASVVHGAVRVNGFLVLCHGLARR